MPASNLVTGVRASVRSFRDYAGCVCTSGRQETLGHLRILPVTIGEVGCRGALCGEVVWPFVFLKHASMQLKRKRLETGTLIGSIVMNQARDAEWT